MTIEERLDRLTERHEALTQTVEIIAGMQMRNEEAHRKNEEAHRKNEALLAQVGGDKQLGGSRTPTKNG